MPEKKILTINGEATYLTSLGTVSVCTYCSSVIVSNTTLSPLNILVWTIIFYSHCIYRLILYLFCLFVLDNSEINSCEFSPTVGQWAKETHFMLSINSSSMFQLLKCWGSKFISLPTFSLSYHQVFFSFYKCAQTILTIPITFYMEEIIYNTI